MCIPPAERLPPPPDAAPANSVAASHLAELFTALPKAALRILLDFSEGWFNTGPIS